MVRKVVWSHEAFADLESIAKYIERDSVFYAAAFVHEIIDASRTLESFSQRGRVVPEYNNPCIRELLARNFRIIYNIEESRTVILGIVHGRRDLKKIIKNKRKI